MNIHRVAAIIALILLADFGFAGRVYPQPPELPDIPTDIAPPKFDLGPSAEAQAEQARTQDQPTVVRTPKPVDYNQLVMSLTVFALSLYIGVHLAAKVPAGFRLEFLSGLAAIAGVTIVGAFLTGTKIASGVSKAHPILVAALGFVAILFAAISVMGGFGVTHRLLGERKRVQP